MRKPAIALAESGDVSVELRGDERRFQLAQHVEHVDSDLVYWSIPIDRVNQVLPAVVLQDRLGLQPIDGHTVPNDLFMVVRALHKVVAAHRTDVAGRQRLERDVKGTLAADADAAADE